MDKPQEELIAPASAIDVVHVDVVSRQDAGLAPMAPPVPIDPVVEHRLLRKIDRVLMPLVFLAYLLAFLDRSNIGTAQTAGMGAQLRFDDAQYQWLLTIFYIPYIIFEWSAIMWKIVSPHIWASCTVLLWGIASSLQAVAFSWRGLMACRWFLAMGEAAFSPGVPYLLSFFYRRHELGVRCGIFLSAAPLATTFAGALAFAITAGRASSSSSIDSWRLLFLVEGLPTIAMAALLFFALPDSPDTARFLTAAERDVARARTHLQSGQAGKDRIGHRIHLHEVLAAFAQPQTFVQPLMYFSCNVSFASLPVFLPAILTAMGYSSIHAQGLTAPPYFLAFLVCIATTYLADRVQQRGLVIAGLSLVGGLGYLLLATVHRFVAVRYLGVFLAAAGVFPAIANILPWVLNNQGTDTKRGVGIAMLNIIGQCGPLLGTRIFPVRQQPYYVQGMSICAAFMFFNALLALALRQYFAHKNRQFARAEAAAEAAAQAAAQAAPVSHVVPGSEKGGIPDMPTEMEGTVGYRYIL